MTNSNAEQLAPSLIRSPLGRIVGSFVSWALFTLCMMLLLQSFFSLMLIGGSCASGGPYSIEVECPDAVALFMPLSIWGGLGSVALSLFLARGFGTSLVLLAWPILFCSLGGGFLWAFFVSTDLTGLIIGVMFEAMGLFPFVLVLKAGPQLVFLGAINLRGESFSEGVHPKVSFLIPRNKQGDNLVAPTFIDWVYSLVIFIVAVAAGYQLAIMAYAAVAAPAAG
jgi:hypothetical protein